MPKKTTTKSKTKTTIKCSPTKKVNKKFLNIDALNDIMTVADMKEFTGYGINQCYEYCRKDEFKVIRNGKNYFIIKDSFLRWFKGETRHEPENTATRHEPDLEPVH